MLSSVKRILKPSYYKLIKKASNSYIAGDTLADAHRICRYLESMKYATTLAYWDGDDDCPEQVVNEYKKAIIDIQSAGAGGYLSIKAPAFGSDKDIYKQIIGFARGKNVPIHLDSLAHDASEEMFELIREHTTGPLSDISYTLPARWRRSLKDAEVMAELGVTARVVKGQWPDPGAPAKNMTTGFIDVVKILAGKTPVVRIATHDPLLVSESIKLSQKTDTKCELELLYGLPMKSVLRVARKVNIPVRIYVPYGHAWMPYCLDRVRNQPIMLWWFFKDSLSGQHLRTMPRHTYNSTR